MAAYRQACSSCTGPFVTAMHDVERYCNEAEWQRGLQRLSMNKATNPALRRNGETSSTPDDYFAESDHHSALARPAEAKLDRARRRLARALDPKPCFLCGGVGYIQAPGTFIRGARGQVEA